MLAIGNNVRTETFWIQNRHFNHNGSNEPKWLHRICARLLWFSSVRHISLTFYQIILQSLSTICFPSGWPLA